MIGSVSSASTNLRNNIRARFVERNIHLPANMIRHGNDAKGVAIIEDVLRQQGNDIILRLYDQPDLQISSCVDLLEYSEVTEEYSTWHRGAKYILSRLSTDSPILPLVYYGLGRYEQIAASYGLAISYFEKGLNLAESNDSTVQGRLQLGLGMCYARSSRWIEADFHLTQAIKLLKDTACRRILAMALFEYGGFIYRSAGMYSNKSVMAACLESIDLYERALCMFCETNSIMWLGMINYSIAWSHLKIGMFEQAKAKFEQALQHTLHLQDTYGLMLTRDISLLRYGHGVLFARAKDFVSALTAFDEALQGFSQYQDMRMKSIVAREKGIAFYHLGEYEKSKELLGQASELVVRFSDHPTLALMAQLELGKVNITQGDLVSAEEILLDTYKQVLSLAHSRPDLEMRCLKHLLRVYKRMNIWQCLSSIIQLIVMNPHSLRLICEFANPLKATSLKGGGPPQ